MATNRRQDTPEVEQTKGPRRPACGRGRTAPRNPASQGRTGPLIRLPAGRFRPPHCPNRDCRFYEPDPDWSCSKWGFYQAPSCTHRLPRFRCRGCGRTFTARTFAVTYWLHHWDLFALLADRAVAGSGIRQTARSVGVGHATVSRHLTRAARCGLILHRHLMETKAIDEPIVLDGFETFEFSQYFPYDANLAVGRESWLIRYFTDSPLRRKGKMTPEQKRRREELEARFGRPDPKAVENGVYELLREIARLARPRTAEEAHADHDPRQDPARDPRKHSAKDSTKETVVLELHSDEHQAYPRAIARVRREPGCPVIRHFTTPSTDPRTRANRLFAVNLTDLLLRHFGADHRRETIAYGKRRQSGLERLAIVTVWRNTIKWRRENRPGETAAMKAGILDRRWSWRDVFRRRLFPRERELGRVWWDYYHRKVRTSALGEHQTENRARYAF